MMPSKVARTIARLATACAARKRGPCLLRAPPRHRPPRDWRPRLPCAPRRRARTAHARAACARRALSRVACARATSASWRCTSACRVRDLEADQQIASSHAIAGGVRHLRDPRRFRRDDDEFARRPPGVTTAVACTTPSNGADDARPPSSPTPRSRCRPPPPTCRCTPRAPRAPRHGSTATIARAAPSSRSRERRSDRALEIGERRPGTARSRRASAGGRRAMPAAPEAARRCRFARADTSPARAAPPARAFGRMTIAIAHVREPLRLGGGGGGGDVAVDSKERRLPFGA